MSADWIALHVFYHSNSNPVITECVEPLVGQLRAEGLLARWFFIKYWQEGPHVRLRLLPSDVSAAAEVERRAKEALQAFLARRPALYETDVAGTAHLYKQMFLAEYTEEDWDRQYGRDGQMPFRANNSVHRMAYEPEYDRYGGPEGVALAEWHFEQSSDFVAELLATANVHVRPVLLGLALQMSLVLAYGFLGDDESVVAFFARYRDFWETSYDQRSDAQHAGFDRNYARNSAALRERIQAIRAGVLDGEGASALERSWAAHARELSARIEELARAGRLVFPARDGGGRAPVEDPVTARSILLPGYVHMTNNRLGVAILDEIYLSYLIEKALAPAAQPAGVPA